jgi:hypothetical protein
LKIPSIHEKSKPDFDISKRLSYRQSPQPQQRSREFLYPLRGALVVIIVYPQSVKSVDNLL